MTWLRRACIAFGPGAQLRGMAPGCAICRVTPVALAARLRRSPRSWSRRVDEGGKQDGRHGVAGRSETSFESALERSDPSLLLPSDRCGLRGVDVLDLDLRLRTYPDPHESGSSDLPCWGRVRGPRPQGFIARCTMRRRRAAILSACRGFCARDSSLCTTRCPGWRRSRDWSCRGRDMQLSPARVASVDSTG